MCRAKLKDIAVVKLQSIVLVDTIDYHGHPRNTGGDPITVDLSLTSGNNRIDTYVKDLENGTYEIRFRSDLAGQCSLKISVFERPIKDYPLLFDVTEHNEPIKIFGQKGSGKSEFHQPVAVAVDDNKMVYIVDTGNSRIKVRNIILLLSKR